jgi:Ca2+-binding EF-hand superfamily protein
MNAISPARSQQIQSVEQSQVQDVQAVSTPDTKAAATDNWSVPVAAAAPQQDGAPILSGNNSESLWGAGAVVDPREANPMPAEELSRPPMFRHLDYFDKNKDGTITIPEMYQGMRDMGASPLSAAKLSVGTAVVRGSMTQGRPSLSINIENAFKSAQMGRSGAFDEKGNLDPKIVDHLLGAVDPQGQNHITMDDFKRAGQQMAQERAPGDSLGDKAKRLLMSKESDLAWNSLMEIAGRKGDDGKPYLTQNDIKWFFDGSLFYRLAAEHTQAAAGDASVPKLDGDSKDGAY